MREWNVCPLAKGRRWEMLTIRASGLERKEGAFWTGMVGEGLREGGWNSENLFSFEYTELRGSAYCGRWLPVPWDLKTQRRCCAAAAERTSSNAWVLYLKSHRVLKSWGVWWFCLLLGHLEVVRVAGAGATSIPDSLWGRKDTGQRGDKQHSNLHADADGRRPRKRESSSMCLRFQDCKWVS